LKRFFGLLALVWLLAWLPLGLWKGDPDFVLTAASRHTVERQVYQGLLYTGLLAVFLDAWRRRAPARPARGRPASFVSYAALGLFSALFLRGVLQLLGARAAPESWTFEPMGLVVALGSALVVALAEEAVFRGFLLGSLAQIVGTVRAMVISSVLFALVHLFRPGAFGFKAAYGLGLFLLAVLLARLAWQRGIAASAGLHAGIILPNLLDPWQGLHPSWWSGWQQEPASGALSWLLTLALWAQWEWWCRRACEGGRCGP
jgi:membrane protease YdiL (CAAX protease family)